MSFGEWGVGGIPKRKIRISLDIVLEIHIVSVYVCEFVFSVWVYVCEYAFVYVCVCVFCLYVCAPVYVCLCGYVYLCKQSSKSE